MMWSWGDGSGWLIGGVFVVFCVMMMGRMMMGRMSGHSHTGHGGRGRDAQEILAERFARGEISEEEFERRRRVLEREPSVDGEVRRVSPGAR